MAGTDDFLEKELIRTIGKKLISTASFKDRLGLREWVNQASALMANQFTEMLKSPDEVDPKPKGYARWNKVEGLFNKDKCDRNYEYIECRDVLNKIHFIPVVHMDYCYVGLRISLREDIVDQLSQITDSLKYRDGLLTASGDFPSAAIVQFAMAKRVNNGKISIQEARELYHSWITIAYNEWMDIYHGGGIEESRFSQVLEKYVLSGEFE